MWIFPGKHANSRIYHNWNGYYYHRSSTVQHTEYLKCTKYRSSGCRARAIAADGILHEFHGHNHNRDFREAKIAELKLRILETARSNSTLSFRAIVHQEGRRFPLCIRSKVTVNSMRNSLARVRTERYPAMPHSMRELGDILLDNNNVSLTKTEGANDSILRAVVEDSEGHCHIILLSERMMNAMEHCRWLFADGHFASRPVRPQMSQIFNLAMSWNHHGIYLGSILMESRTEEAYKAVIEVLLQLMPNMRPEYISCDFEKAQQNAWTHYFPNSRVVGCLWHFCRAIIKKCFKLGLGMWLRRSRRFRRLIRMCCILPLLPQNLMRHGLFEIGIESLRNGWFVYEKMFPLLEYLETKWITNVQRSQTMCVHGCEHRTNNILESINRYMRSEVGPYHPNTYALLEGIVRLEGMAMSALTRLHGGELPARERRTSAIVNDERIQSLTNDLFRRPLGLRYAVRNFIYYASNTVRQAYNDLIGFAEVVANNNQ